MTLLTVGAFCTDLAAFRAFLEKQQEIKLTTATRNNLTSEVNQRITNAQALLKSASGQSTKCNLKKVCSQLQLISTRLADWTQPILQVADVVNTLAILTQSLQNKKIQRSKSAPEFSQEESTDVTTAEVLSVLSAVEDGDIDLQRVNMQSFVANTRLLSGGPTKEANRFIVNWSLVTKDFQFFWEAISQLSNQEILNCLNSILEKDRTKLWENSWKEENFLACFFLVQMFPNKQTDDVWKKIALGLKKSHPRHAKLAMEQITKMQIKQRTNKSIVGSSDMEVTSSSCQQSFYTEQESKETASSNETACNSVQLEENGAHYVISDAVDLALNLLTTSAAGCLKIIRSLKTLDEQQKAHKRMQEVIQSFIAGITGQPIAKQDSKKNKQVSQTPLETQLNFMLQCLTTCVNAVQLQEIRQQDGYQAFLEALGSIYQGKIEETLA